MIDEGSLYNRALNPVEIKTIAGVKPSTDPTPRNGATVSTTDVLLEWWQGSNVAFENGHHLYFSDQIADVNTGAAAADKGLMTDPNYRVTGLVPGTTYFWRVDEVNDVHPDKLWRGDVWSFTVASEKAAVPSPADGTLYVNRERTLSWAPGTGAVSHRVFFGVDQAKVAAGAADVDKGVTTDPNYTPETLTHDATYYWRVDEFDGAATHEGDVWSFQTTASADPNLVGWWTFDDGYLDISGNENHGWAVNNAAITTINTRPYTGATGVLNLNGTNECVYVPYSPSLDIATAGTVAMWLYGGAGNDAPIRHGGWNASYSFRLDNAATRRFQFRTTGAAPGLLTNTALPTEEWTHVALTFDYTVPEPGNNQKFYLNGKLDAENRGATAIGRNLYYVAIGGRENATAMWGGMLDDVRLYNRALAGTEVQVVMTGDPNLALDPKPADRSIPDELHATPLSWKAGANAAGARRLLRHRCRRRAERHRRRAAGRVPRPPDRDDLHAGRASAVGPNLLLARGRGQGRTSQEPVEGNGVELHVADYLIVDDFESYTDEEGNRIYQTWIDGFADDSSGSTVGHMDPPFAERTIVHGGRQSMPLDCNNVKAPFYSEAWREFSPEQDWTVQASAIWSCGCGAIRCPSWKPPAARSP